MGEVIFGLFDIDCELLFVVFLEEVVFYGGGEIEVMEVLCDVKVWGRICDFWFFFLFDVLLDFFMNCLVCLICDFVFFDFVVVVLIVWIELRLVFFIFFSFDIVVFWFLFLVVLWFFKLFFIVVVIGFKLVLFLVLLDEVLIIFFCLYFVFGNDFIFFLFVLFMLFNGVFCSDIWGLLYIVIRLVVVKLGEIFFEGVEIDDSEIEFKFEEVVVIEVDKVDDGLLLVFLL